MWSSSALCWGRRRGLEAGVQLVFSGPRAGLVPRRAKTKGQPPRPSAAWSRVGGALHKAGVGRGEPAPRASAILTADPHHCERRFLRLIPTSMKTAGAGPPAGPLS